MAKYRVIYGDGEEPEKKQPIDDPERLLQTGGTQTFQLFSKQKENLFHIDRNSLVKNSVVTFPVYKQQGTAFSVALKADAASPKKLTDEILQNILNDSSFEILIRKSDIPHYYEYLKTSPEGDSLPENEQIIRKAVLIKETSKVVVKDLFDDPRSGQKINEMKDSISQIVNALHDSKDMIYSLMSLIKHDYYTYTHCVNVAVLAVGLGMRIGLNEEELSNIGIGAMIHDIGKTVIPADILNKQGKLNIDEYRRIKEHVREGRKILDETSGIPVEAYDAVLQHHEKLSGKGYPFNLNGNDISLFGRLTGIADCYDSLTTSRPNRAAFDPFHALMIISREKDDYDIKFLTEFIKMLGKIKS
ncbi:MAG: HD domain-containing protein [Nitrospirae bacterium]|nr:HD domain-containing protein [Nitrospirota bacterium]